MPKRMDDRVEIIWDSLYGNVDNYLINGKMGLDMDWSKAISSRQTSRQYSGIGLGQGCTKFGTVVRSVVTCAPDCLI